MPISLRRLIPRFRFSLRTMMIVVTVVTIVAGLWGRRYLELRERFAARKMLEASLCRLGTQYHQRQPAPPPSDRNQFFPKNLRQAINQLISPTAERNFQYRWERFWFGEELADPVIVFSLPSSEIPVVVPQNVFNDPDWKKIASLVGHLPDLRLLTIDDPSFTTEELKFLKKLPHLRWLAIRDVKAEIRTDRFFEELLDDNQLEAVVLDHPRITPAGVKKLLAKSPRLKHLSLWANGFDIETAELIKKHGILNVEVWKYDGSTDQEAALQSLLANHHWESVTISGTSPVYNRIWSNSNSRLTIKNAKIDHLTVDCMSEVLVEKSAQFKRASFDSLNKLTITDSPTTYNVGSNTTEDNRVTVRQVDQIVIHEPFKEALAPALPRAN